MRGFFWERDLERIESFWERDLERNANKWQAWANEHGWTYQAKAPELVGRFRPPYADGAEGYFHLLATKLHGLDVMAFERRTCRPAPWGGWTTSGADEAYALDMAFVVVRLPGLPPPEFESRHPERAIRRLGGSVPSGWDLEFMGDQLIAHRTKLDPGRLEAVAELLAIQVAAAPTSLWRPQSSQT